MIDIKGHCTLLISSLHYDILYLFSGIFTNVHAMIYFQFYIKHQVTKGCKKQVNTQLLISQEMT